MREFKYTVTAADIEEGLDIRTILRRRFTFSARLRSKIKRNRTVYRNGEQTAVWITPEEGDEIMVAIPDETSYFEPEDVPIYPLFEDEDLLIINKPAGYTVHPTRGHKSGTIANGVAQYMLDTDQSFKIRFINRLDMETSGVLLLGKNQLAQGEVMKQMKADTVTKLYRAIVHGIPEEPQGVINEALAYHRDGSLKRVVEDDGKPSETHYRVIETFPAVPGAEEDDALAQAFSLVELDLKTGRTHQIRVHMAHIGCPVAGDSLYGEILNPEQHELPPKAETTEESGEQEINYRDLPPRISVDAPLIGRQALHSYFTAFDHPVSGERIEVTAPLPDDMVQLLEQLRQRRA
jgi:23S rRNA pseudouridine1911/1915/1917 synthase